MGKKKGLDWEEHEALGSDLRRMRNRLQEISGDLSRTYGKNSKIQRRCEKAYLEIDKLRNILDDQVGVDHPDKSDRELNHCYYPGTNDERLRSR